MMRDKTCKERISAHYRGRMEALRAMMKAESDGNESGPEEYGPLNEYGLCFDYVAPGTFNDQRRGYLRYQLSWGGPSDEFRFYLDEGYRPMRVEYWFLDWFDGAHRTLRQGRDFEFLCKLLDYLTGGEPEHLMRDSA